MLSKVGRRARVQNRKTDNCLAMAVFHSDLVMKTKFAFQYKFCVKEKDGFSLNI